MEILLSITLFASFGALFLFINLVAGSLLRPSLPNPDKLAVYECGELSIGTGCVQFDLRFYIIALVYLIFDVEVTLFYPWAVLYGSAQQLSEKIGMTAFEIRSAALLDMLFFFGVLMVGFAYLWRFGYLDWVRSTAGKSIRATYEPGIDLSQAARIEQGR